MSPESIGAYNAGQNQADREICDTLRHIIDAALPDAESKIWHAHPVWFLNGNPIVGYSKLKGAVRLLFWSGQSFVGPGLSVEGKFKAAERRYTAPDEGRKSKLQGWLGEARDIQWDYRNIVRNKGRLDRLR